MSDTKSMVKAFMRRGGVVKKLPDRNKPPKSPKIGMSHR